MDALLLRAGQAAGLVGLALLVFAVLARLAGYFVVGGLATGTLMLGGIGAMSVACYLLLLRLNGRDRGAP